MFRFLKAPGSPRTRPATARGPRLALEALDARNLCSAAVDSRLTDLHLTAVLRREAGGHEQVVVDGSDYGDTVRVEAYDAATGTLTIRLKNQRIDQSATFHGSRFDPKTPVVVYGKGGTTGSSTPRPPGCAPTRGTATTTSAAGRGATRSSAGGGTTPCWATAGPT